MAVQHAAAKARPPSVLLRVSDREFGREGDPGDGVEVQPAGAGRCVVYYHVGAVLYFRS